LNPTRRRSSKARRIAANIAKLPGRGSPQKCLNSFSVLALRVGASRTPRCASSIILDATSRVFGSSVNLNFSVSQTLSSASDICRIASGSNACPARYGVIGIAFYIAIERNSVISCSSVYQNGKKSLCLVGNIFSGGRVRTTNAKKQSVAQMYRKRSPDDHENAARIRELIGRSLKEHYQACLTGELPPRLLSLLEKLDEDTELSGEQIREPIR